MNHFLWSTLKTKAYQVMYKDRSTLHTVTYIIKTETWGGESTLNKQL